MPLQLLKVYLAYPKGAMALDRLEMLLEKGAAALSKLAIIIFTHEVSFKQENE